ncbi:type I polyketide synthase [Actinorugispora endophytica]|uniref:Acyl transferase domain-containing protein n=1 Tax=Actinorugispora endophytica TaxID=1605990 RepID=A0A4R6UWJ1_9ACTN|nr:type I polyketide synthase [Actinorugispora endophytica]TDQ50263.1 acyl transferase domain-containing protein [Actinorugispora endophytica]
MRDHTTDPSTAIAVTGLACRFPGAPDAESFWDLLVNEREGLTRLDDATLDGLGVRPSLRRDPAYVPVAGVIDGQDLFDPEPFGLTDAEAALMDPQQRLFLECAWQALEEAGHGGGVGAGSVGVFAGAAQSAYLAANLPDRWEPTGAGTDPVGSLQTATGTQTDYLPLQAAYRIGLTGPAIAVNTACSTSLVAVHAAAQSLATGECDTALAGGASLIVPQGRGYLHTPDGVYSADGTVRPFSSLGSGVVYTQGVGAVVLRRLRDALDDGDPVLAVVHGSAVNNDGAAKAGFTAPSTHGQARVLAEALAVAGAEPRHVGYVEAHGTGTRLGDPVETAALRRVYGSRGPAWCGLGSVKSNIGHANTAAGIASFIKTVLALKHRVIPASLHAEPVNELLGLDRSPFRVVTRTRAWDGPALAGVSSFGIGGTNAHVILGPAPERAPSTPDPRPQLLPLAAHGRAALTATAARLAGAGPDADPADLAHTLQNGRAHGGGHRLAAVVDGSGVAAALRAAVPVASDGPAPRVVFAFPGGGSQYAGMGADLYAGEPVFAACVDECAALLEPLLGTDIRDVVTDPAAAARARDAASGLPALFTVSLATARLLESWGARPDAVLGHSLGEYCAAVVGGALPLADAARLVAVRSTGAARSAGHGVMLSVPIGEDAVAELLTRHPDVDLAVVNAPDACVVSGPRAAVGAVERELTGRGLRCTAVHVDVAAHSRLVEPAMDQVRAAARGITAAPPTVPVVSTVTGGTVAEELGTAEYWADQLRNPVRFAHALRTALGDDPDDPAVLVQVGPGAALAALARRNGPAALRAAVTTLATEDGESDSAAARAALGALWTHGVPVDFGALHAPGERRRIAVPGYAFQRRRLWIDPPAPGRAVAAPGSGEAPDADDPLQVPVWAQTAPLEPAAGLTGRWLLAGPDSEDTAEVRDALAAAGALVVPADRAGEEDGGPWAGAVVVLDADPGRGHAPDAVTEQVLAHAGLARLLSGSASPVPVLLQVGRAVERVESTDRVLASSASARVLPRVLGQESPGTVWRTLDVGGGAAIGPAVLAELADLADGRGGVEAAVRGTTRWVRDIAPWRPAPAAGPGSAPAPDPDARPVALITGGLGDVGLTIAAHLSGRGMRVVATSRSAPPAEAGPDPRDDRALALRALAEHGTPVEVRTLDAGDAEATTALLAELADPSGPGVALVVHAAGVVATADLEPLRAVSDRHVAGHVRAKVEGALALRAAVDALEPGRRPAAVLLMSSAGTLVGGIGMGPYSAANAFLDALAAESAGTGGTRWLSVVWDAWKVGPLGRDRVVNLDFALGADTGMAALDRLLAACAAGTAPPVVAVSTTDLRDRVAAAANPAAPPAGDADTGSGGLDPVEQAVAGLWSELFGAPVRSADADFFALGGHSLLATRMLAALRRRFGAELGLRDVLARPTVAGLAALVRERAGASAENPDGPALAPAPNGADEDADAAPGTFPMTRVQHAYWVGRDGGYGLGGTACHFFLEYDCPDLDLKRYEQAWNRVVERHAMLRAVTTPQGRFAVLEHLPRYRIRTHDLTALPQARREERLARLRERVSRDPGPSDRWPLFQVRAALLPGGRTRLFIGVDVLVCDAASYWIIDREVQHFYENPDTALPEPGVDFAACAAATRDRRGTPGWERAAAYWRARVDALPGAPALPVAEDAPDPAFTRRTARLDAAGWTALQKAAARHGATPAAVLLTAYAEALAAWSGDDRFALTLTLFDRPEIHPDVDAVVGDFTSLLLHEVDLAAPGPAFADRARATHERLFEDLDHREFSALDVLAERASRTGRVESVPVVFTSALGLEDVIGGERDLQWVGEQVSALSQTPQTWLDHQVLVQRGELLMQWDALEPVLPAGEVDRVFADYVARVRRLAADPGAWGAEPPSGPPAPPLAVCEDAVLPMRSGTGERTLFLVHPSGGDVLCYAELSRSLDPRLSVAAVTDPVLVGGAAPDATIEGMARYYVELLRRHQGEGPYLLGGWSMGGSLGQEMARQLHERGQAVDLLLMFDSNDPAHITHIDLPDPEDARGEAIARHLGALEGYLGVDLGVGDGRERAALIAMDPDERWAEAERRLRARRLLGRRDGVRERVGIFDRHMRALADHTPRRLADARTATLLVRADRAAPRNSGIGMGVDDTPPGLADLGWGRYLAGPLEVVGADADHYSLLRPPATARLAETVNEALLRHAVLDRP